MWCLKLESPSPYQTSSPHISLSLSHSLLSAMVWSGHSFSYKYSYLAWQSVNSCWLQNQYEKIARHVVCATVVTVSGEFCVFRIYICTLRIIYSLRFAASQKGYRQLPSSSLATHIYIYIYTSMWGARSARSGSGGGFRFGILANICDVDDDNDTSAVRCSVLYMRSGWI